MIYIAEQEMNDRTNREIDILEEISKAEYDRLFNAFSFYSSFNTVKILQQIVIQNGTDFTAFIKSLNHSQYKSLDEYDNLIITANKLILNYATSLKAIIDIAEKHLREKKGDDAVSLFQRIQRNMYDTRMEYRIWMNLRNFVVHCGFPYTRVSADIQSGVRIYCEKEHLLQFKNWKHAQNDILMMEDKIALEKLIEPMNSMIIILYIEFVTAFYEDIIQAIKSYRELCQNYKITKPVFCKVNSIEDLKSGNIELSPIPIYEAYEAFDILKSNPRVKIRVVT